MEGELTWHRSGSSWLTTLRTSCLPATECASRASSLGDIRRFFRSRHKPCVWQCKFSMYICAGALYRAICSANNAADDRAHLDSCMLKTKALQAPYTVM